MHDFKRADHPSNGRRPSRKARAVAAGVARRLGLERNPLRRRSDHVEARARVAALLLCAVAVPLAVETGVLTQHRLSAAAAHEVATREHHSATVLDEPHLDAARSVVVTTARVAWTDEAGQPRQATVLAPAGTRRGDRMTVWSTRDGVLVPPPLSGRNVLALAGLAASGLLLGVIALSLVLLRTLRWLLDRGRYRDWEAEWAQLDTARRR